MAATNPVGINSTLTTGTGVTTTTAFAKQSDTLRVVAETVGVYVAIGANPTVTNENFYVSSYDTARLSLGTMTNLRVTGITKGAQTTLDLPEGMASPFVVGDAVSLTVSGIPTLDFEHKLVTQVLTSSNVGGFYSQRIVVDHDSSSVSEDYNENNWAQLRESFKVAVKTESGTGKVYIQQVQVS